MIPSLERIIQGRIKLQNMRKTNITQRISRFICFLLAFFSLSLFTLVSPAKAAPVTKTCSLYPKDNCKCDNNQCRLSIIGSLTEEQKQNKNWSLQSYYTCYDVNTLADGNSPDQKNYLSSDDQGYPLYTDDFAHSVNKAIIPPGSICRRPDGTGASGKKIAYWYYPGVYEGTTVANRPEFLSQCYPPFLVTKDLFGKTVEGTKTAFGCIPNSINGAVAFFVRLAVGFGAGILVLIILVNLIKIIASSTNPDAVTEARKKMVSALTTLGGLVLMLTILSIINIQVINVPGIGGGLITIFTGK